MIRVRAYRFYVNIVIMSRIILASASPARKNLMKELKLAFSVHTSGFQENMNAYKNSSKLAKHLAEGKATFIAHKFPDCIIIGADTFITVGTGRSLEKICKPSTIKEAKIIIKKMSAQTIAVHSGIAVIKTDPRGKISKKIVEHVVTKLTIKKMSSAEIHGLAHQKDALQISGAFSIEGAGGKMVEKIDGDYNNVIGLPLFMLRKMLKKIGVKFG